MTPRERAARVKQCTYDCGHLNSWASSVEKCIADEILEAQAVSVEGERQAILALIAQQREGHRGTRSQLAVWAALDDLAAAIRAL